MTYPQQPAQGQPYPPAPPVGGWPVAKKRRRWPHIAGYTGTALLFLLIGIGAGGASKTATTNAAGTGARPAATVTVSVMQTVTAKPAAPATTAKPVPAKPPPPPKPTIDDGYQVTVPGDVPAGRYDAHSQSDQCYWEIDKTASSDIVDNDLGKLGHLVVTLRSGETFSSHDCGTWTKE